MTQDGLLSQGKLRITRFCDTKTAFHYKYRATYPAAVYNQRKQPDPEVFLLAAEKLHQKPCDCLVVEDAGAGVKAALNGGLSGGWNRTSKRLSERQLSTCIVE